MTESSATRIRRGITAITTLALFAAGCTGGATQTQSYHATFASVDCPSDVRTATTRETKCGYLEVPEDRSDPTGRQIHVFVFRIEPGLPTEALPVVFVGDDIGSALDYRVIGYMADHLDGPEVIGMDERGTGYSQPNLSCPEVAAISPRTLTTPIDDPGLRQAFVTAVKACHDRLVSQGIDLSAYGVEGAGADMIDLVHTLGLTQWDVISKGSTSRIVFEAMRAQPAGLKAVVLYNPEFPDTDPFVQAFQSTQASIDHLASLCDADARCSGWFGDVAGSLDEAIRRFDHHPVSLRIAGARVLVDGAGLLRDLRNFLAGIHPDSPAYLHLPATVDALAHAKDPASSLATIAAPEVTAPTFCVGFQPTCSTVLNQGAYYSALCRDIAPFASLSSLAGLAAGGSAWKTDYADGPYVDVCGAWAVSPAPESVTASIESDVPVLVYSGGFDPFVTTAVVRDAVAGLPNAFVVAGQVQSHWVAGGLPPPCADDNSRNEFLADPTTAPNARCQEHFKPKFVSSPL
jgi:pimeloyl-ACP methyl ester carboxylesterase